MTPDSAAQLIRDMFMNAFWLSAPLLAIGFVAGIVVSLVQIVTSIQDTGFNAVPRLLEPRSKTCRRLVAAINYPFPAASAPVLQPLPVSAAATRANQGIESLPEAIAPTPSARLPGKSAATAT